ncbi:hypothetical protein [Thermomonospora umbrina]|uniref:hypothetical protein n=1 Tax=Thermomonospora umbrina TaxID=111806 RepID=UPI000E26614B|nr:hypothetical protein [Thermomonospora umbrina]
MSTDVIALTNDRPDVGAVLEGLGPRLRLPLAVTAAGGACRVYDDSGRLVVFVTDPTLVTVPGEVERLLCDGVRAPAPVWWVDIRAAADLANAAHVARSCADELVARHGGTVWSGAAR